MTSTAYDAQSFVALQKKYGNEAITKDFFQNRCVTDNGKTYFRTCENGYGLKTTYEFHQNMICEGFVTAKKSSYTDAATRRDVLTMALKMRTKKETEEKKMSSFKSGMFLDVITPGLTRIVSQGQQYGLIAEKPYFRPENGITRAESYAIIMKSVCMQPAGSSANWQENLFQTARANSMTSKSSLEKFRPDSSLTRGELMSLASRASDWAEKTGGCNPKPDVCFMQ